MGTLRAPSLRQAACLAQPFVPAHVWLVLRRGSPAPPCSLLPVLRRHGRPPGTTVSRAMRRGPPSRRALLSRRVECRRVHAHAPAQGRRLQRDAALLGAGVREPSARPQLRDHSRPLELCAPSVESGGQPRGQGEGREGPGACHPAATPESAPPLARRLHARPRGPAGGDGLRRGGLLGLGIGLGLGSLSLTLSLSPSLSLSLSLALALTRRSRQTARAY